MNKFESQMSSCSNKDTELFKDNLNISDFFNEQFNTLNGSSTTSVTQENDNRIGNIKTDMNNGAMNGHGQMTVRGVPSGQLPQQQGQLNVPMMGSIVNGFPVKQNRSSFRAQQEQRVPTYDHHSRLPDSPPETDSGAGSAGSPSGSETSPFSPEYQQYHPGHAQGGSVIHSLPVSTSHDPQAGILLNVNGLDNLTQTIVNDYLMPMTNSVNNGHLNGQHLISSADFYSNQAANNLVQQISPGNYTPDGMSRKRARSDSNQFIKPEPSSPPLGDDMVYGEDGLAHQSIRFFEFQKEQWHSLCDISGRELLPLGFHVVADKGFNFSHFDGAFVNQKKNHFQISAHIEVRDRLPPKFVRIPGENGVLRPIQEFQLDFYGVKTEMLSSSVQIKQSQTDRKPIGYEPVKLDLPPSRVTKVTVARLHFSETTMNNQRKNNRPNPDQKYLYLVVALNAVVSNNERYTVVAFNSEKVIVRASNPGQFDTGENEVHWQKGQNGTSIYHPGPVGIGTDKPTSTLTVAGDIQYTGTLFHPSDGRLKQNIQDYNCAEALSNLSQIRIVRYEIKPEIAEKWGMSEEERHKIGVIAQELEQVLPDAVKENSEYKTVDDNRIFYESAAAVKELCRLTGNLEYKIDEVEKISKKFAKISKLNRFDSFRSSVGSTNSTSAKKVATLCASYLSCSNPSINNDALKTTGKKSNSTTKNEKDNGKNKSKSDSEHYHHHHHHVCRPFTSSGGICKSKVIQMTIVILVLVMAFCLIAMATLYVLDWHKRNSSADSSVSSSQSQVTKISPQNPGPGQMTLTKPPMLPHNTNTGKPRKLAGGPILHPCLKPPCVTYCCQNPTLLYTVDPQGNNRTEKKIGQQVYVITQNNHPPPIGQNLVRKNLNPGSPGSKPKHIVHPEDSLQFDYAIDEMVSDVIDGLISDDDNIERRRRRNSRNEDPPIASKEKLSSPSKNDSRSVPLTSSSMSVSNSSISMRIIGLNVSLDDRYLFSEDKKGNFSYYIPVSIHMPHIPLEIEFGISNHQQVNFCSKNTTLLCTGLETASFGHDDKKNASSIGDVHKRQVDTWELPVGTYHLSSYKFRVGSSTTLCNLTDDEVGATFTEYNLLFYRVCQS